MTTFNLKTDALRVFTVSSGTTYTADAYGKITGVVAGNDLKDLLADGCTFLGSNGGLSNLTATTNPAVTDDSSKDYAIGSLWFNSSSGVLYVAKSVGVGTASWQAQSAGSMSLPMVTGRFYGLPRGATQAAVLTVSGALTAYPVYIPSTVTLASISMSVTTGQTGGKVRGALFADSAGYPGAIVAGTDTGDLDGTATAVVTKSSLTAVLSPGWYWFGSIATASSTYPSVIGATATYADEQNAAIGSDTAAHALATASQVTTGIVKTGQTYPVTDMTTSFPTFPASGALAINVTTPIAAFGV